MAATIIPADVLAVAPELAGKISDQAWVDIVAYVNEFDLTQVSILGFTLPLQSPEDVQTDRLAKMYLAAHMATLTRLGGKAAAGPVTSESVGGVRRSYGLIAMASGSSSLSSTRYGQLYLEIVGASVAGPMLV